MKERKPLFADLAQVDEWEFEARRLRLRHDDQFYGPMKGATCGCGECRWARRFLAIYESANSHARAEQC